MGEKKIKVTASVKTKPNKEFSKKWLKFEKKIVSAKWMNQTGNYLWNPVIMEHFRIANKSF